MCKSTIFVQIFKKQDNMIQTMHKKFHTKISLICEDYDKKKTERGREIYNGEQKTKMEYLNEGKEGKITATNHFHTTITQRTRQNELKATVSLDHPTVYVIITSPPCVSNAGH